MSDAAQDNTQMPNPTNKPTRKNQFQARLDNQKSQLERHGNFAEVVIRTTPEGTDMINFARLWEYVLVQADRKTRGYVAKSSRADFESTRQGFEDSIEFMASRIKDAIDRHDIDLTGNNFISRVAQRYDIAERKKAAPKAANKAPAEAADKPAKAAAKPKAVKEDAPAKEAEAAPAPVDEIEEI